MGLFGGFKAKFTRNTTTKNKPQDVVCLRYHIHSEFDGNNVSVPLQINNNIKNPEVARSTSKIKERKALAKSAIYPGNETAHSSVSSVSKPKPQKSVSLQNLSNETSPSVARQENGHAQSTNPITVSSTFTLPRNGQGVAVSDIKLRKTTEEHNGVVTEKTAVVANNHLYTKEHDVKNEQHSQTILAKVSNYDEDRTLSNSTEYMSNTEMSYLKPSTAHENSNSLNDQSTLIFMTQHSSRSSSFDRSMENDAIMFNRNERSLEPNKNEPKENRDLGALDENFNFTFVPNKTTVDNDEDHFKVNVVKHDLNRTYSYSEDEQSQDEEEPQFSRMGYSSQAASIFFGEGEEVEVARPRRIQLMEESDDERRSSGADC